MILYAYLIIIYNQIIWSQKLKPQRSDRQMTIFIQIRLSLVIITTIMRRFLAVLMMAAVVLSALPTNFTWGAGADRNYLSPAVNQNNPHRCESGWAWAAINSLNTRINIKIAKAGLKLPQVSLSAQVLLECDDLDFGCLGGEPSQALRWINKHNITDSSCNTYKARGHTNGEVCSSRSKCEYCTSKNNCSGQANAKIYSLSSVGAVSGENSIIEEIFNNGPVACGLAATSQLKNYTGGIFTDKSGVFHFSHYVSVYGWGQTTAGVKYWLVQNSYGPTWGEEGNFKMLRGENNLGIESLCYYGVPSDTWTQDIRNKTLPNQALAFEPHSAPQPLNLPKFLTASTSHVTPNYCDASWAFAVVQAMSDTASIRSNGQISKSFSVQTLLNCGVGSCEKGGDPFEALSFIHKYGVTEQACQYYTALSPTKESCSAINNCATCSGNSIFKSNCSDVKNYRRWKMADYGSVSGEAQMKIQLQNHQALICGIELSQAFRAYTGGVFEETTVSPKINHYVQILGYGSEGGKSYWLGRAFLGSSWGLSGFFKIKTGSSNLGIETKCYWAGALL